MKNLGNIEADFEQQLDQIRGISDVHEETQEFVLGFVDGFKNSLLVSLNDPSKKEFDKMRTQIERIKDHKKIKEKYNIIYSQSLVLLVSAFESAMNEVFKFIINEKSSLISWPVDKKKIQIDVSELGDETTTPGDLVLKAFKENVNFQNPDSTLRFCSEYLKLGIPFSELSQLKFFFMLRHVVAHNGSKVDTQLIGSAKNADRSIPRKGSLVEVRDHDYLEADRLVRSFFSSIVSAVKQKIDNDPYLG